MFKAAPNVKGCITASIGPLSNVFLPDSESYAKLAEVLGEGGTDHTYIKLGEVPNAEYVRVTSTIAGTFIVSRGVDNTDPQSYPALTEFEYVLTAAAMQDILSEVIPTDVQITGIAPVVVVELASNQFSISIPVPTFVSSDASVDVTGSFPNFDINVVRGANGCCD